MADKITTPTQPYPVRLTDDQRKDIKEAAEKIGLSFPETMRKAIDFGLPELVKILGRKSS